MKPVREMRAKPVELQRLVQDRLERTVKEVMPHTATLKLAMNEAVLILVPITNPEAFPIENHGLKIIGRRPDQLGYRVVLMKHQEFVNVTV